MSRFMVDIDQISAAANNVRATSGRITNEVQAMQAQLQGLQQTWQGGASNAFQSVAENWHVTQRRVDESLQQINQALEMAGAQYLEVETANHKLFRC
ncbi:MAG TPA: WXG100 family type VII secretion target [Candidatus Agrococcus pullicola]|uniref:ESAT-6-like protein n=1 Tax=Candidatus Agrococcus pullicola TaxID=2838429 RepID=A0A9D2C9J2_9MICO|nr:WXG100 family type VII secretion target [Candidatus Agrococcus pullicola]